MADDRCPRCRRRPRPCRYCRAEAAGPTAAELDRIEAEQRADLPPWWAAEDARRRRIDGRDDAGEAAT